jgi:hypothetical protein
LTKETAALVRRGLLAISAAIAKEYGLSQTELEKQASG